MVHMEPGLYVRMQPLTGERAPQPQPFASGFNADTAYRVIGMHTTSETADAYLVLCNDRDEMWFICTRHVRVVGVCPHRVDMRIALAHWGTGGPPALRSIGG